MPRDRIGALLTQHGAQVNQTAMPLGIQYQFSRLAGKPLAAEVGILDLEVQARVSNSSRSK
jgi:hypothetical protein